MIGVMYERVAEVTPAEEAARLTTMADSRCWAQPQHQLVADLIGLNGHAAVLWCCAPVVLEMMHALWDEHPQPGMLAPG